MGNVEQHIFKLEITKTANQLLGKQILLCLILLICKLSFSQRLCVSIWLRSSILMEDVIQKTPLQCSCKPRSPLKHLQAVQPWGANIHCQPENQPPSNPVLCSPNKGYSAARDTQAGSLDRSSSFERKL